MNLKTEFPFINYKKLKAIVYSTPRHEKIRIGNVVFDRHSFTKTPRLVYDALARDKDALAVVGHFINPINRKRAEYYPYFNRCLSKGEIKKINKTKNEMAQPTAETL